MKFKEIRDTICSLCKVITSKYQTEADFVLTHEPTKFDEMEVIGLRSRPIFENKKCVDTYIEVHVK